MDFAQLASYGFLDQNSPDLCPAGATLFTWQEMWHQILQGVVSGALRAWKFDINWCRCSIPATKTNLHTSSGPSGMVSLVSGLEQEMYNGLH